MNNYKVDVQLNFKMNAANAKPIMDSLEKQFKTRPLNLPVNFKFSGVNANQISQYNIAFRTLNRTITQLGISSSKASSNLSTLTGSLRQVGSSLAAFGQSSNNLKNFQAGTTNLGSSLNTVGRNAGKAGREVISFAESVGVSTRRFASFGVAASIIATTSIAIRKAIGDALEFDRELVRLKQVGGDSDRVIFGMEKTITRLGTSLGVSSKDMSTAAVTLRQAGFSARDTSKALEVLGKTTLSPTFEDLKSTTEGLIAVFNQFGGGVDALEGQFSAISKVSADYAVESSDLVEAVKRTGGAFKAAGGNLNELLAMFTTIRSTTRESAESIATGMRTILARLQDPTIAHKLRAIGVEVYDLKGRFVGPLEAITRLSDALKKIPQGDIRASNIIKDIGGLRQLSRVIPLIYNPDLTKKVLDSANSGANKLSDDARVAQEALLVQLAKIKEGFLDLFRVISTDSSVRTVLNGIIYSVQTLTNAMRELKPLVPVFLAFATVGAVKYGLTHVKQFSKGITNPVSGYAEGGFVSGPAGRDKVPAMLTQGEYVIPKEQAQHLARGGQINVLQKLLNSANIDLEAKKYVRGVHFTNRGNSQAAGFFQRNSGLIAVKKNKNLEEVLLHEFGHAIDFNLGSRLKFPEYGSHLHDDYEKIAEVFQKNLPKQYDNHKYFTGSNRESFAEAFKLHALNNLGDYTNYASLATNAEIFNNPAFTQEIPELFKNKVFRQLKRNPHSPFKTRSSWTKNDANNFRYPKEPGGDYDIPGFAEGGTIAGSMGFLNKLFRPKGTDTIPAMLTKGEYVVNKDAAQSFGYSNLEAINRRSYRMNRLRNKYSTEAGYGEAGEYGSLGDYLLSHQLEHRKKTYQVMGNPFLRKSPGYESRAIVRHKGFLRELINQYRLSKYNIPVTPFSLGNATELIRRAKGSTLPTAEYGVQHFAKGGIAHPKHKIDQPSYNFSKTNEVDPFLQLAHGNQGRRRRPEANIATILGPTASVTNPQNPPIPPSTYGFEDEKTKFFPTGPVGAGGFPHLNVLQNEPSNYKVPREYTFQNYMRRSANRKLKQKIGEEHFGITNSQGYIPAPQVSKSENLYHFQGLQNSEKPMKRFKVSYMNHKGEEKTYHDNANSVDEFKSRHKFFTGAKETLSSKLTRSLTSDNPTNIHGSIKANSLEEAKKILSQQGKFVTSIKQVDDTFSKKFFPTLSKWISGTTTSIDGINKKSGGLSGKLGGLKKIGSGALLGASIAAPMIAEHIFGTRAEPGNFGETGAKVGSVIGGLASGAAGGAAVGSLFGPAGTAIGALGGAALGAVGALKQFSDETREVHLKEFAEKINSIKFNDQTGNFSSKREQANYNNEINKLIPEVDAPSKQPGEMVKRQKWLQPEWLRIPAEKGYVPPDRTLAKKQATLAAMEESGARELVSSDITNKAKNIISKNPELEIGTVLNKVNDKKYKAGLTASDLITPDDIEKLRKFSEETNRASDLQKRMNSLLGQINQELGTTAAQLEAFATSLETSGEQYETRSQYSAVGAGALAGQITAAPSNVGLNNLGEASKTTQPTQKDVFNGIKQFISSNPKATQADIDKETYRLNQPTTTTGTVPGNLHAFATTGGGYDQSRKALLKIVQEASEQKLGNMDEKEAAISTGAQAGSAFRNMEVKGQKIGGQYNEKIANNAELVIGNTTKLKETVDNNGVDKVVDQILAPFKEVKDTGRAAEKNFQAVYAKQQQEQVNKYNRKFELRQQSASLTGAESEATNQAYLRNRALNPDESYQTSNKSKFIGGSNRASTIARNRVISQPEAIANDQFSLQKETFRRQQSEFGASGLSASTISSRYKEEENKLEGQKANYEKEKKGEASTDKLLKLNDEILKTQDNMRNYGAALKNLAENTGTLEAAQRKYENAVGQFTADYESRKKDADVLAFGSQGEKMQLAYKENVTQQALSLDQGQFAELPDQIKKIVFERLQETQGQVRTVEQYNKYGQSRGTQDIESNQALQNLRQPYLDQLQGGYEQYNKYGQELKSPRQNKSSASFRLRQNAQQADKVVGMATENRLGAQRELLGLNQNNTNKQTVQGEDNFQKYLAGINQSIAEQMQATNKFLEGSAKLTEALNSFKDAKLQIERNGRIEVIINGAQALQAIKGDLEKEILETVVDKLKGMIEKQMDDRPVR